MTGAEQQRKREREREREKGRSRKDETVKGTLPSGISWRHGVANSLKVRYHRDDVEPCLVAISIINTTKNNRGSDEPSRKRLASSKKIVFLLGPFFCYQSIGEYRAGCGLRRGLKDGENEKK